MIDRLLFFSELPHRMFVFFCFFFNDTATTEIYTLSLHDALPIFPGRFAGSPGRRRRSLTSAPQSEVSKESEDHGDRKSTRLNSSHLVISYAVFCLKKKKLHLTNIYSRTVIFVPHMF